MVVARCSRSASISPRFGEHADAPQRRADHLGVQRRRRRCRPRSPSRSRPRPSPRRRVRAPWRMSRACSPRARPGPSAAARARPGRTCPSTSMKASSSTGSKWRPRCSRIICTALLDREGLAVDAIAGERVEHVRDRDDPPLDRDRLALQARAGSRFRPTSPGGSARSSPPCRGSRRTSRARSR